MTEPLFSVCVCAYGDYPELSVRCVRSITRDSEDCGFSPELHVGCNTVGWRTRDLFRELYEHRKITTLIESGYNYNKCGMQRALYNLVTTPYALWLDDDYRIAPGALLEVQRFIEQNHPFDVAGIIMSLNRYEPVNTGVLPPFHDTATKKRWWKGLLPHGDRVHFPAGGINLVRMEFLRAHGHPDYQMVMDHEDALLGELVAQTGGKMIQFSPEVLDRIRVHDAPQRGEHRTGQLTVDERTGASR